MISQNLVCHKGHEFEAWFRSHEDCQTQLDTGLAQCPICASSRIEKRLNRPNLPAKHNKVAASSLEIVPQEAQASHDTPQALTGKKTEELQKAFQKLSAFVEDNFENVGNELPEIARRIHYGEEEERGIFGHANQKQAEEMQEEGITLHSIPWFRDRKTSVN
ncbi:MAG: DUF1178 family protein [Pseudomonadota bacterium]